MFRHIGRRAAILAAQRQTLGEAADDEADGGRIADGFICGQQADHKGRETHDRHGDKEGIFAADEVAEAPEEQRAERAHGKACSEAKEHENESRRFIAAWHEGRSDVRRERSSQIEVVPFENRTR